MIEKDFILRFHFNPEAFRRPGPNGGLNEHKLHKASDFEWEAAVEDMRREFVKWRKETMIPEAKRVLSRG